MFHQIVLTATIELQADLYKTLGHVTSTLYSEKSLSTVLFFKLHKLHSTIKSKMHNIYWWKRHYTQTVLTFPTNINTFAEKFITTFSEDPFLGDHMCLKN